MIRRPPRSTRTDTLFPYTTLFRSGRHARRPVPDGALTPLVTVEALLAALRLEPNGPDRYRAPNAALGHGVVFGGQLLAQSIVAALAGNDAMTVKTLHTVFARGVSFADPLDINVDRMQAGRSIASRTVTISQGDRPCVRPDRTSVG